MIFLVNASLFIKTAIVIRHLQLEIVEITSKEDNSQRQTNLNNQKDR